MQALYNDIKATMAKVEAKWQKFNYSTESFPELVWECTEKSDFSVFGDVQNQLKLLDLPDVRQLQEPSTFSDLYFRIFHSGRCFIEILNWWGGHVNVHDHDFSAVQFQLKGDALNVTYDFHEQESNGALRFGKLVVKKSEIWREGSRSLVRPDNTPHSVFHIGTPTTSLLIRTVPTTRFGAQSNYFPDLSAHYYVANSIQRKKLTGLSLLSQKSPVEFAKCFNHFLNTQSLSENFFMMVKLGPMLFQEQYTDIVNQYANRGPREAKLILNVIINNGIDYLKTLANETPETTTNEKLAIFGIAAATNPTDLEKVLKTLYSSHGFQGLYSEISSFISRLSEADIEKLKKYLNLFNLSKIIHEDV